MTRRESRAEKMRTLQLKNFIERNAIYTMIWKKMRKVRLHVLGFQWESKNIGIYLCQPASQSCIRVTNQRRKKGEKKG